MLFVANEPAKTAQDRFRVAPLTLPAGALSRAATHLPAERILSGADSTQAALRVHAAGAASLSVLAHGVRPAEWSRPVGFATADGWLGCDAIEQMRVPTCVMLYVCRAGHAAPRRGESSGHHLGGAFLIAGADVVGLADEDLELSDCLLQMETFHAALHANDAPSSPAEAMRRARQRMLADGRLPPPMRLEGLAHQMLR